MQNQILEQPNTKFLHQQETKLTQIIAHIDMDCFFCSCEIKRYPHLLGKPIIVGSIDKRGVVSAANYEARKFGVFSATPISKARKLCSHGVFLPVDHNYYREESKKIMKILKTFSSNFYQVSVDEAYLDITNLAKKYENIVTMSRFIQKKIYDNSGMSCSIGISESKTVSKIASDYKKPAGITIVYDQKKFLKNLPIETIPGIGKVSKIQYNKNNIYKIGDLLNFDRFKILELFGLIGIKYYNLALGTDKSKLKIEIKNKSTSRETTFKKDITDQEYIKTKFQNLATRLKKDLNGKKFKNLSIKIRYSDFSTFTRDITLKFETNNENEIFENAYSLYNKSINPKQKIRLIGIKLSKLSSIKHNQSSLESFF